MREGTLAAEAAPSKINEKKRRADEGRDQLKERPELAGGQGQKASTGQRRGGIWWGGGRVWQGPTKVCS